MKSVGLTLMLCAAASAAALPSVATGYFGPGSDNPYGEMFYPLTASVAAETYSSSVIASASSAVGLVSIPTTFTTTAKGTETRLPCSGLPTATATPPPHHPHSTTTRVVKVQSTGIPSSLSVSSALPLKTHSVDPVYHVRSSVVNVAHHTAPSYGTPTPIYGHVSSTSSSSVILATPSAPTFVTRAQSSVKHRQTSQGSSSPLYGTPSVVYGYSTDAVATPTPSRMSSVLAYATSAGRKSTFTTARRKTRASTSTLVDHVVVTPTPLTSGIATPTPCERSIVVATTKMMSSSSAVHVTPTPTPVATTTQTPCVVETAVAEPTPTLSGYSAVVPVVTQEETYFAEPTTTWSSVLAVEMMTVIPTPTGNAEYSTPTPTLIASKRKCHKKKKTGLPTFTALPLSTWMTMATPTPITVRTMITSTMTATTILATGGVSVLPSMTTQQSAYASSAALNAAIRMLSNAGVSTTAPSSSSTSSLSLVVLVLGGFTLFA